MFTPVRFLAAVFGCLTGAAVFVLTHGRPLAGLALLAAIVLGAVLVFVVGTLARQNAYNRRAAADFAVVLAEDAAHHALTAGEMVDEDRQVTR